MNVPPQSSCRNLLLRSLRADDFELLEPNLGRLELNVGEVLATAGEPIQTICFPESGIVTFSDTTRATGRVGIGHVGYDGLSGWPVILGSERSWHEARVTAEGGSALCIPANRFHDACLASETLRNLMLRFVQAFAVQLSRTIVSSLTQPVETRLCRWTLMAHDRIEGDEIKVTHDEIAVMLAVRRASVTDALHILEGEGLVRGQRGRVVVRDRPGLRQIAGDTYGFYEAEYSRLIAPFPRHSD